MLPGFNDLMAINWNERQVNYLPIQEIRTL